MRNRYSDFYLKWEDKWVIYAMSDYGMCLFKSDINIEVAHEFLCVWWNSEWDAFDDEEADRIYNKISKDLELFYSLTI